MMTVNTGYLLGLGVGTGLSALAWAGSQFLDTPSALTWVLPGTAALGFAGALRLQAWRVAKPHG